MKKEELRRMIREELEKLINEQKHSEESTTETVTEKSVPQPYNRKGARPMNRSQIEKRKKIGQNMMSNEKTAAKFRKKYGDEWKDYLWAAATSAAFREK